MVTVVLVVCARFSIVRWQEQKLANKKHTNLRVDASLVRERGRASDVVVERDLDFCGVGNVLFQVPEERQIEAKKERKQKQKDRGMKPCQRNKPQLSVAPFLPFFLFFPLCFWPTDF